MRLVLDAWVVCCCKCLAAFVRRTGTWAPDCPAANEEVQQYCKYGAPAALCLCLVVSGTHLLVAVLHLAGDGRAASVGACAVRQLAVLVVLAVSILLQHRQCVEPGEHTLAASFAWVGAWGGLLPLVHGHTCVPWPAVMRMLLHDVRCHGSSWAQWR